MKFVIISIFYLFFPYVILRLSEKYAILKKIGPIIIAFIIGFAISFSGILAEDTNELIDTIMNLSVILALPLLLFGSNFSTWKSIAGKTLLSFLIGISSLIVIVCLGYLIWGDTIENANKVGGMMIGLYTGGTPNLAAIKSAIGVDPELYLMITTYDLFYGVIFLLSIMSFGKILLKRILPKFKIAQNHNSSESKTEIEKISDNPFKKGMFKQLSLSLALSIIITGISIGICILFVGEISMLLLILSLTTLSIVAGLNKKIKTFKSSFSFGMYFIIVFSLALASMVKTEMLMNISYDLFLYIGFTIFGTLFLHIAISKIFKIDRDTTIVTSTALICSPPFVPMIANTLKNRYIILPGISIGIIGYAIGNYLGVLISLFLENYL